MSSCNPESVSKQGEFHASVPRSEPLMKKGHKPGVPASPTSQIPTFHAKTLPPGTAPPEKTFIPNNPTSKSEPTTPLPTPGATSADVHKGLGHPGVGMSSSEMHHNGQYTRKREKLGLQKHGSPELRRRESEQ